MLWPTVCAAWQVDLHGLHVEEALARLENQLLCLGGLAADHPEGLTLRVIVGEPSEVGRPYMLSASECSALCFEKQLYLLLKPMCCPEENLLHALACVCTVRAGVWLRVRACS